MKITTELKSRKLSDNARYYLYGVLTAPIKKEYDDFSLMFNNFLFDLIRKRLFTDEIKFIVSRPYCVKSNRIIIDPEKLGLPKYYDHDNENDLFKIISIGGKFDLPSDISLPDLIETPTSTYRYYRAYNYIDRTDDLIANCTEDEIDQLKDHLIELAKKRSEVENFGVGTWIRGVGPFGRYTKFPDISTWGQMLAKSPELFKELYDNFICSTEDLEEEVGLIEELKKELGY